jgi:hypothetical protein
MTAFLGGKTAYKVKDTDDYKGYEVVVINSETMGYSKDSRFTKVYEDEVRAQGVVDKLNDQLGVTALEADAIFICSMFRPGEYEAVLKTLREKTTA